MTKIIVSRAVELLGAQACILFFGTLIAYACHVLFGLTPEAAAENLFAAQLVLLGFTLRGWL